MPTCLIENGYIYCFKELQALSCIQAVLLVGKQPFSNTTFHFLPLRSYLSGERATVL